MQLKRARFSPFLLALLTIGCGAPQIYSPHPLVEQILRPRTGFEGSLTNRTCKKYDGSKCLGEEIQVYPLNDQAFRESVNKFNFICSIGGRRFKICRDKPGFCRFTYKQSCFLGVFCKPGEKLEEYTPVEQYRFLLDADTRCANKEIYDLWAKP